jgi:hypothetical protein
LKKKLYSKNLFKIEKQKRKNKNKNKKENRKYKQKKGKLIKTDSERQNRLETHWNILEGSQNRK